MTWTDIWDKIVRFRLWLVATGSTVLIVIAPLLGAPEVLAIVPDQYDKYLIAAAFLLAVILRPMPARRATDPETQVMKQMNTVAKTEAVVVEVKGAASGTVHGVVEKEQK